MYITKNPKNGLIIVFIMFLFTTASLASTLRELDLHMIEPDAVLELTILESPFDVETFGLPVEVQFTWVRTNFYAVPPADKPLKTECSTVTRFFHAGIPIKIPTGEGNTLIGLCHEPSSISFRWVMCIKISNMTGMKDTHSYNRSLLFSYIEPGQIFYYDSRVFEANIEEDTRSERERGPHKQYHINVRQIAPLTDMLFVDPLLMDYYWFFHKTSNLRIFTF